MSIQSTELIWANMLLIDIYASEKWAVNSHLMLLEQLVFVGDLMTLQLNMSYKAFYLSNTSLLGGFQCEVYHAKATKCIHGFF